MWLIRPNRATRTTARTARVSGFAPASKSISRPTSGSTRIWFFRVTNAAGTAIRPTRSNRLATCRATSCRSAPSSGSGTGSAACATRPPSASTTTAARPTRLTSPTGHQAYTQAATQTSDAVYAQNVTDLNARLALTLGVRSQRLEQSASQSAYTDPYGSYQAAMSGHSVDTREAYEAGPGLSRRRLEGLRQSGDDPIASPIPTNCMDWIRSPMTRSLLSASAPARDDL